MTKRLILVNGTMGVGKTATCSALLELMLPGVFLDGDWCWNARPFVVNADTKAMVMSNIVHQLRNFLYCPAYETVIFCWVMDRQQMLDDIAAGVADLPHTLHKFTLTASYKVLEQRLQKDIDMGLRHPDCLEKSTARLPLFRTLDTQKVYTGDLTPRQAAQVIRYLVLSGEGKPAEPPPLGRQFPAPGA